MSSQWNVSPFHEIKRLTGKIRLWNNILIYIRGIHNLNSFISKNANVTLVTVLPEYCDEVLVVAEDPDKKMEAGCLFPYVYTASFYSWEN